MKPKDHKEAESECRCNEKSISLNMVLFLHLNVIFVRDVRDKSCVCVVNSKLYIHTENETDFLTKKYMYKNQTNAKNSLFSGNTKSTKSNA